MPVPAYACPAAHSHRDIELSIKQYKYSALTTGSCQCLFFEKEVYLMYHILFYFFYLFSVLKTFLHDPLVEWSKPVKGNTKAQVNETGEVVNEKVSLKQAQPKVFKCQISLLLLRITHFLIETLSLFFFHLKFLWLFFVISLFIIFIYEEFF